MNPQSISVPEGKCFDSSRNILYFMEMKKWVMSKSEKTSRLFDKRESDILLLQSRLAETELSPPPAWFAGGGLFEENF